MITFKHYITELFDKPWKTTVDPDLTAAAKEIYKTSEVHKNDKIKYVRVHKLEGDNGHMISYHRNGCLEVHHHDIHGVSGEMHKDSSKPNPRFISTMKHHLETEGLDKGHSVRIRGNDENIDHYTRIAKHLCRGKSRRIVTSTEIVNGKNVHNIEVHPYKPGSLEITELLQTRIKKLTEKLLDDYRKLPVNEQNLD